jgi:hypothetical protein
MRSPRSCHVIRGRGGERVAPPCSCGACAAPHTSPPPPSAGATDATSADAQTSARQRATRARGGARRAQGAARSARGAARACVRGEEVARLEGLLQLRRLIIRLRDVREVFGLVLFRDLGAATARGRRLNRRSDGATGCGEARRAGPWPAHRTAIRRFVMDMRFSLLPVPPPIASSGTLFASLAPAPPCSLADSDGLEPAQPILGLCTAHTDAVGALPSLLRTAAASLRTSPKARRPLSPKPAVQQTAKGAKFRWLQCRPKTRKLCDG